MAIRTLLLLLALAPSSYAQSWLQAPATTGNSVSVGSATLKLPPGDWILATEQHRVGIAVGGPISSQIEQKVVYQIEGGRLAAVISIAANQGFDSNGWLVPAYCMRRHIFYRNNDGEYPSHYDCLGLNHIILPDPRRAITSVVWSSVYAKINGVTPVPNTMVFASYNYLRGNRGQFINVDVYVNPETSGYATARTSWLNSPWNEALLDRPHRAYLDAVVRWAEAYRATVRDAW